VVQDHYDDDRDKIVSHHNTKPARPRLQCARPRSRPRPIFWSQTAVLS